VIIERDTPGETNFVKRMDGRRKGGRNGVREETTVNVVRIDGDTDVAVNKDGKKPPTSSVPAAITAGQWRDPPDPARLGRSSHWGTASRMHVGPPKATNTDLGSRDSEGERADVKRTSYTIRFRLAKSVTSIRLLSLQNPGIRRICWGRFTPNKGPRALAIQSIDWRM